MKRPFLAYSLYSSAARPVPSDVEGPRSLRPRNARPKLTAMSEKRRIAGLLVGLVGAGLMGWALFSIFTSPECLASAAATGGGGCSSNPPPSVALGIAGGIILATIGMLMGGGMLVFSALFLAIGLAALVPTALGMMPAMETFGWLFGGAFLFFGLLPVLGGLALGRMGAKKQAMAGDLYHRGVKAIGTIVEVGDTGMTINDNPRVTVRMRVAPLDGSPPIERSKTVTVSRVAIPRAGDRHPVWFDRMDPDKWMFATDMDETAPAEVKDLFARAAAGADGAAASRPEDGAVEELARLAELWKEGALTDAEFAEAKAKLLSRIGQ